MRVIGYLLAIFFLVLSFPTWGEELSIVSNPEQAEVFVRNASLNQDVKIGKTPLKISLNQVVNNFAKSTVFVVEVRKEGFEPYRVLLTKTGSTNIELNVNLDVSKNIKLTRDLDFLMGALFDVQRRIRAKDYSSALTKLEELEKDYPHFSIIYEMKGSCHYLQKQFQQALSYYRKAFAVNPENRDAYTMKIYLEKKFNLKPVGNNG